VVSRHAIAATATVASASGHRQHRRHAVRRNPEMGILRSDPFTGRGTRV